MFVMPAALMQVKKRKRRLCGSLQVCIREHQVDTMASRCSRVDDALWRQQVSHHQHRCRYCPFVTTQASLVSQHECTHAGERPFQCAVCLHRFAQNFNLTAHLRSHTGERPHRCPACPARFVRTTHLSRHLRAVHRSTGGVRGTTGGIQGTTPRARPLRSGAQYWQTSDASALSTT
ncbi:uncharacterized protein LOC144175908 [Haemaphysalis longicornis]